MEYQGVILGKRGTCKTSGKSSYTNLGGGCSGCNEIRAKGLDKEAARGLHKGVLMPTLSYVCETLVWYEYWK